ncbi:MlaD family protein [Nocardia seriolae]|uniref:Mce family protein n=1 Tax=Nocardia seriolae TaxID=37332 RepID=A0A0B8NB32_9NOCA|nr:MlaD family protein [Nocardia seriolae]MTJ61340.1 mammalian cell entry protein [Nocardia seriolae]MTJ71752.1 mammalian cell entry protein [Nocardia seriolae]MTJ90536.1 mammalian cell entry protein [Nocardia seriolae]MTK34496.1 mammalian cell entry protein [Nocardia seriolae]MTK39316.1 mammalian cell entry protein [Nocardia seriolae]
MPNYGMPGVAVDRKRSMTVGAVALALVVAVVAGWSLYRSQQTEAGIAVSLRTEQIGDGVLVGTEVRANGVVVGKVTDIAPDQHGTQQISLRLDDTKLFGIDDSLQVDYAPANLFGISEIELRRGAGGSPLRTGAVLDFTGRNATQVYDATMGSILRSASQVGGSVLTQQMASVIAQAAADTQAFMPLVQALITAQRTITDNQKMPMSQLFGELGPAFDGGGQFAGATVQVIDLIRSMQRLQNDRAAYDKGVATLTGQLLPALANTLSEAGTQLSSTTDMLVPILTALAQMVPQPQQSGAELKLLLQRLSAAMPDNGQGPVLNVQVDLKGVPGIAVPLLGGAK